MAKEYVVTFVNGNITIYEADNINDLLIKASSREGSAQFLERTLNMGGTIGEKAELYNALMLFAQYDNRRITAIREIKEQIWLKIT